MSNNTNIYRVSIQTKSGEFGKHYYVRANSSEEAMKFVCNFINEKNFSIIDNNHAESHDEYASYNWWAGIEDDSIGEVFH